MIRPKQVFETESVTSSSRGQSSIDASHNACWQHDVRCIAMVERGGTAYNVMYDASTDNKNRFISFESQLPQLDQNILHCSYVFVNFTSRDDHLLQLHGIRVKVSLYCLAIGVFDFVVNNCYAPDGKKKILKSLCEGYKYKTVITLG